MACIIHQTVDQNILVTKECQLPYALLLGQRQSSLQEHRMQQKGQNSDYIISCFLYSLWRKLRSRILNYETSRLCLEAQRPTHKICLFLASPPQCMLMCSLDILSPCNVLYINRVSVFCLMKRPYDFQWYTYIILNISTLYKSCY